ncbi:MAG: outer membrane protein assembly factor BamD [Candidatus Tectomicrobia bacterium]|uniref:Outer membrane protein assembly factor BamD n=1 Tax=Tectimicrobiota bacterium TaxID=2528274 RepID=A0A932GMT9_UNCTE|nr:outer membrane protein assembly factor BamD [Candidatus Tectomicrobia bacterium]
MKECSRFHDHPEQRHSILSVFFLLLTLALPLGGCGMFGGPTKLEPRSASEWYILGEKNLESKDYEEAQKAFARVLEEYTDNRLRIDALLQLADSYYANKQYIEASYQYKKFVELYPLHPAAAEAQFQVGMSNMVLMKSLDRDQSYTREAIKAFEQVINRYPDSPFVPTAKDGLEQARERLAAHEFYVGRFYFMQRDYDSAISRLTALEKSYPEMEAREEVLYMLGESYFQEENFAKASHYYSALLSSFPKSRYIITARKRLQAISSSISPRS